MRISLVLVAALTSALMGCTPGLEEQVDGVAGDVAALSEENAALETENALLTRAVDELAADLVALNEELAALSDEIAKLSDENASLTRAVDDLASDLAALMDGGTTADSVAAPLVRIGSDRSSGAYSVSVDGEGITYWEVTGSDGASYAYDPVVWAAPKGDCHTFTQSGYLLVVVWVWQGDVVTCYGEAEGCAPMLVTALDEMSC